MFELEDIVRLNMLDPAKWKTELLTCSSCRHVNTAVCQLCTIKNLKQELANLDFKAEATLAKLNAIIVFLALALAYFLTAE